MRKQWPAKRIAAYAGLLAASLAVSLVAGWTALADRIDHSAYDTFFNWYPPAAVPPHSAVLAIDEDTLRTMGGTRHLRAIVAAGIEAVASVKPAAIAVDVIVADPGDPSDDERLQRALASVKKVVLPCELIAQGWEDPLPAFRATAAALGHVHADDDSPDGISRSLPLEKLGAGQRRWALALEAFRLAKGAPIIESPQDLEIGDVRIPAPRTGTQRALRVVYQRAGAPSWSIRQVTDHPETAENFRGKTVFIGYTALSTVRDRLFNPYHEAVPGIAIHQQAFETIASGRFLVDASNLTIVGVCLGICVAAGLTFAFLSGWYAYAVAALLLVVAHSLPTVFFRNGVVFPYSVALSTAWIPLTCAAAFQYFVVRRALRRSESDKARYQQAIHFVTHEMRSPLTAIQGSSELMGRYNLTEEKRKQMASMINSESKRLARMIQTFLDVERLTDGQMELKKERFAIRDMIRACLDRVLPLAERKHIVVHELDIAEATVTGDRELMEYAFYNLLTNAVKYSPAETEVFVASDFDGSWLRLSVRDQGIGMDAKELKNIFRKFYRTKRAEASGEVGTGIGLSIVEQIVSYHGGHIDVASTPGKGSAFTMVVPAQSRVHSGDVPLPHAG